MIVTAWSNGSGSFGLKVNAQDRDKWFKREWKKVLVQLDGVPQGIIVNIDKPSFWTPTCRELIHHEIGEWLQSNHLAPWASGHPPKLPLEQVASRRFRLYVR